MTEDHPFPGKPWFEDDKTTHEIKTKRWLLICSCGPHQGSKFMTNSHDEVKSMILRMIDVYGAHNPVITLVDMLNPIDPETPQFHNGSWFPDWSLQ